MSFDPASGEPDWFLAMEGFTSELNPNYATGGRYALPDVDQPKADKYTVAAEGIPIRTFVVRSKWEYALAYRVLRDSGEQFWHFTLQNFLLLQRRTRLDGLLADNAPRLSRTRTVFLSRVDMSAANDLEWASLGRFITSFADGERHLYLMTNTSTLQQMEYRYHEAFRCMSTEPEGIVYPYGVA